MKYLKKFEETDFDELDIFVNDLQKEMYKYWKVDMKNFRYSFYKIVKLCNLEVTEAYINNFENNIIINFIIHDVYITYNKNKLPNPWGYSSDDDYLTRNKYTYMGEIKITPEDIENYNLWIKSKKYNL